MDIEAHEIYALEGMKELLSKKAVKDLIIEVHPKILHEIGKTDAEVIQIFENSNYKVHKFHKESEAAYHIQTIPSSLTLFLSILLNLHCAALSTTFGCRPPSLQKTTLLEHWQDKYFDPAHLILLDLQQWTRHRQYQV
jgi:hypothetical protein